jgi:hypothetical protein
VVVLVCKPVIPAYLVQKVCHHINHRADVIEEGVVADLLEVGYASICEWIRKYL